MAISRASPSPGNEQFSLVLGGPLYQLLIKTRLLTPPTRLVHRRIIASILITWFPLALLTAIDGTLYGGIPVPFLYDLGNTRFLIALPILIAAELIVHRRIRSVVEQFVDRRVIAPEDQSVFDGLIDKAMKLRNSTVIEIILIVVSYTGGHWIWQNYGSLHIQTWYATPADGAVRLSPAGYWFVFVSLPVIRFILLRWYFRLFIWYLFLWRISRMQLRLNALHPDRAGGLGFLSNSIVALTPFLVAQTCFLSAQIGNEILYEGAQLPQFQFAILGLLGFLILTVLAPLLFFTFQLVEAKLSYLRKYGAVASQYDDAFAAKWFASGVPREEPVLGNSDFQSLADIANSFEVVRTMRTFAFDKASVLRLAIWLAVPFLPLAATMFSSTEILERLVKLLI